MLLDTRYQVETPEGIDLYAQLAGPAPRIVAYLIDVIIRGVALFMLYQILPAAGRGGVGILWMLTFLLEWFYPVLFEVYSNGQTPGKKAVRLVVVNDDLTPISWNTSIIRNLLRAADFFPFAYCLGIVSMILSRNFQRLGDIAAGALVIHQEEEMNHVSLPNVPPRTPPVALSVEDQIAIIGFAQRHEQLTPSRQRELAAIVQDVMRGDRQHAVEHLQGVGCWLLRGQR
jgi:uncharacterized RDD family membrane protein YckC